MQVSPHWIATAAVVVACGLAAAPAAHADPGDATESGNTVADLDPVADVSTVADVDTVAALGGGSGIVLGRSTKCSLTTIGYDAAGRLVGFTAGHCAEAGTPVRGEQFPDAGVLGVVRDSDAQLDYAVIEFDPSVVTPLRTVNGSTIAGFAPAPPAWSIVCQNGRTSGHACGVVWASSPVGFMEQACSSYGDSGAPVTIGDQLVGLISAPLFSDTKAYRFSCTDPGNPIHTPVIAIAFDTVRAAVDAGKGVGSGFQPI
ncbi:hypothetical protein [Nocardia seriolae]|nr:hypothetical protein [Nocardia seriolae]MTJ61396.1 hypothetical protein [Nocardia seriolae]MTJ74228.1 hypothetical protein [Nocardia seriolae]MTJ91212.1 hypothetical protein [Nocardia seriolae]MTK35177.1 hypothetical protein [Nocardia seriolae]MTK39370.1 hypothetical protein [Nocardia seriolae]